MTNGRAKAVAQGITSALGTVGFAFFAYYLVFSLVKLMIAGGCK